MPDVDVFVLMVIVTAAYSCAGALGFGANVLTVALGAHLLPVQEILPAILPTSLGLSAWIAWRQRRQIAGRVLTREVLPLVLVGFPLGLFVFQTADTVHLQRLLGAVVAGLALVELLRPSIGPEVAARPLPRPAARALLVGGGFVQGLFASGGPLVVYVLSRRQLDKGAFRATLCLLWVLLNSVLLVTYGVSGRIDEASLRLTAWAVLPMIVGLTLGQRLHLGLRLTGFRLAVDSVLLASGVVLLLRG
jgi:uncharacterized membrane protein YfcA